MGSRPWPGRWIYAGIGGLLSAGAPLGLLAVRAAQADRASADWARDEIATNAAIFIYVTTSTLVVFVLFGYVLGHHADRLLQLAQSDPLTALHNARVFQERLEEEWGRARRYGHALSLLLIDVDGLKGINDRRGHRAGDAALVRVAAALRRTARQTDLAARWGGDEFALLAPDTNGAAALRLGERVCGLVRETADADGEPMTVSVGVATTHGAPDDGALRLRERADAALYAAKRQGRNRVVGEPATLLPL